MPVNRSNTPPAVINGSPTVAHSSAAHNHDGCLTSPDHVHAKPTVGDHASHGDAGHASHDHHQQLRLRPTAEVLLSAHGLGVTRGRKTILEQIDLDIGPREIVTLIGPNGAGKTTLVRVLLGLLPPSSGHVYRRPGLRTGYAPQRFDLVPAIPLTVSRFLRLGGAHTDAQAAAVLVEVGARRLGPTQLADLSGGELQRVVLARALLRDPDLLVLDEPVRGVDYAGEAELYRLISRLRDERGLGVLLVSHDLHVVMAQSDRVICVNRHICCSGVPETVAKSPEYVRLFGPAAAQSVLSAFAVYSHHHDHTHDLDGGAHQPDKT
jgi:zinc transport system ATP-binding protein